MEAEEKRMANMKEMAGDSEILLQRREAEAARVAARKPQSILQRMGLQRPEQ